MARFKVLLLLTALYYGLPSASQSVKDELNAAGVNAVFPGDSEFAAASKAYNLRFTAQPAAIAFPTTAQQVADAVQAGASTGSRVVARSGGHSYVANGIGGTDGALVVDLRNLKTITVDNAGKAVIGTGNRLGDVILGLNAKGRALPHGTCSYVGLGGHSGHGGFGFTSRMWGLTLDPIRSLEVVLANGTITTASKTQNADLFWAMRGAASSFGITTSITFQTFQTPAYSVIFQYGWDLNATATASAIRAFQDYAKTNIPKELGAELVFSRGSAKGKIALGLTGGWYGAKNSLDSTLAPFLNKLPKAAWHENHGNGTYLDSAVFLGGGTLDTTAPDITDTFYAKSLMTPSAAPMTEAATLAFTKYLANEGFDSASAWFVQIELYGGTNSAINAVPLDDTSFGRRNSLFTFQLYAYNSQAGQPFPNSGFGFVDRMVGNITVNMPTNWDYGAYANYVDDRLADWQNRYYGSHYPRLKTLKTAFDPNNVFRFPTSIEKA